MIQDLKIYGLNLAAMMINFMQVDLILKIILTGVAIGYTVSKWILLLEQRKQSKKTKKDS